MSLVSCDVALSLDGFMAGPNQSLEHPLGEGADTRLHTWMFDRPEENAAELAAITDAGAFIMGRNMFGPVRGPWETWDAQGTGAWRGWWGEDPPYHAPVFVLTHHPREPLTMDGGTTFYFVSDGPAAALDLARAAAGERGVSIGGGARTINQFLADGLIDELRLHLVPVVFGAGERLFDGLPRLEFTQAGARATSLVTHLTYRRAPVDGG
ncbi:dihydrofolate reductase family protein [Arthrobacter sp. SDTb3-6]|uniref:dihydrofolate reductase family protein n=1 Tax=Arthrobacter sp. SDTb3-6 TaxID=2713571 RepID=UPI00159D3702|nr:dihydrofolate reductase family protein [Arthrobacter sp. SDTb3-6]NVM99405.1 dihydrofolate reductase [Arthrobacter sp. SDTb3-6]